MTKSQAKTKGCLGCVGFLGVSVIGIVALGIFGVLQMSVKTEHFSENRTDTVSSQAKTNHKLKSDFIPGLAAVDVHGNFTDKGFTLTKDFADPRQPIWQCIEETAKHQMMVEVFGDSPTRITLVRATYSNYSQDDTNQSGRQFMGYAASIPYDGSEPSKAQAWVEREIGKKSNMTIGGVTFELYASAPRSRMLVIRPASEAQSTMPETEPVDREKAASSKLRLAKQLLKENKSTGQSWLQDIVKKYPGTAAAKEAEELLKQL